MRCDAAPQEALVQHPATWPIIMELTHGRPRFTGATLMVNWRGGAIWGAAILTPWPDSCCAPHHSL
jgi:hypothetical protein